MNFIDDLGINGHLQIAKLYKSGEEEIVFDDHNIIVSGMSVGLTYLFAGLGSTKVTDFQIDRVQLGVSGYAALETSTTYQLSGPLSSTLEYGTDTDIYAIQASQLVNGSTQTSKTFLKIPHSKITRINDNSLRYTIVLDEEACNNLSRNSKDLSLNEIGLFMKNPTGQVTDTSILVAYRVFSSIRKTDDFSLIFRWTINF